MPVDFYYCYVDPHFNDWDIAPVIDNKCTYSRIFKDTKQPKTYFCRVNQIWTDSNTKLVSETEILDTIKSGNEFVIKQANNSEGGSNIFFVRGEHAAQQFQAACKTIKSDIVVQEAILQHEQLSMVNPTSVNTIRILSLLNQKEVKIYSAILRMGIAGSRVDNISRGGIACGINQDGSLKPVAYNYLGQAYHKHPTTGVDFDTIVIPNFDQACKLVKDAHPAIPNFRLVSWDLAIEQDGTPVLVEANLCYGELNLHQLNNGPVFGEDTQSILNEVFDHKSE